MRQISILQTLDLIIAADAIMINNNPASLLHYPGDDDLSSLEEGDHIDMASFATVEDGYVADCVLHSTHKVSVSKDDSCLVVTDENKKTVFGMEFLTKNKVSSLLCDGMPYSSAGHQA